MKEPKLIVRDGATLANYEYEGGYGRKGICFFSANPDHFTVYGTSPGETECKYHRIPCIVCKNPVMKGLFADSSDEEYAAVVICADCLVSEASEL